MFGRDSAAETGTQVSVQAAMTSSSLTSTVVGTSGHVTFERPLDLESSGAVGATPSQPTVNTGEPFNVTVVVGGNGVDGTDPISNVTVTMILPPGSVDTTTDVVYVTSANGTSVPATVTVLQNEDSADYPDSATTGLIDVVIVQIDTLDPSEQTSVSVVTAVTPGTPPGAVNNIAVVEYVPPLDLALVQSSQDSVVRRSVITVEVDIACDAGYSCAGHGICVSHDGEEGSGGTCECNAGWAGATCCECDESDATASACNGGTCSSGKCECSGTAEESVFCHPSSVCALNPAACETPTICSELLSVVPSWCVS